MTTEATKQSAFVSLAPKDLTITKQSAFVNFFVPDLRVTKQSVFVTFNPPLPETRRRGSAMMLS